MEIPDRGREIRAARPARRAGRNEQLRRLPRPPLNPQRRANARCHSGRQSSPCNAHRSQLLRRWSAARRGVRLGLVPAEQDASERGGLRGLSRAACPETACRRQCAVYPLPRGCRVRCAQSPPPYGWRQGCTVRHLSHADAKLHGDPRPAGSQPAHPAPRSLDRNGQSECLYSMPYRKAAAVGSRCHGPVVWQELARATALWQHLACWRVWRKLAGRARLAWPARTRRQPDGSGDRQGDSSDTGTALHQPRHAAGSARCCRMPTRRYVLPRWG